MSEASLDVNRFLQERGRLPHLGDEVPPWRYRGWLLYYAQGLHAQISDTGNRWGYWMRTLEAGELLSEPIPRVHFGTRAIGQSNCAPVKSIEASLRIIEHGGGSSWDSFRTFVEWLAWGLAVSRQEPRLEDPAQEKLYRSFDLRFWLEDPGDHLGEFLAATKASGWNPTAFYPTPHDLCEAMVVLSLDIPPDGEAQPDLRLASVCDPAVGTGRMLLHASNYSLRLFGQDIDSLVVAICKVNGALYAPWLSFPMPEEMLARCKAMSGALTLSAPPAEPEAVDLIVEAVSRARELVAAVMDEEESMEVDRSGQGLLFS